MDFASAFLGRIFSLAGVLLLCAGCTLQNVSHETSVLEDVPLAVNHFHGQPRYPMTTVNLPRGLVLRHLAKPGVDPSSESIPTVGSESNRSRSRFQLSDSGGQRLLDFPSMLSEPTSRDGEFENYYRQNDEISVFGSASGNTFLIVEDRSPTFPVKAFHLIRNRPSLTSGGASRSPEKGAKKLNRELVGREIWIWGELKPEPKVSPEMKSGTGRYIESGPSYARFPVVVGLADDAIYWESWGKRWKELLP